MMSCAILGNAQAQVDTTFTATSNPFVKYMYLGDPAALVDGKTLYVYAGHDECPDNQERYVMNEWSILSTTDMVIIIEHNLTYEQVSEWINAGVDYNFGREKTHYINLQSWLMGARYDMLVK